MVRLNRFWAWGSKPRVETLQNGVTNLDDRTTSLQGIDGNAGLPTYGYPLAGGENGIKQADNQQPFLKPQRGEQGFMVGAVLFLGGGLLLLYAANRFDDFSLYGDKVPKLVVGLLLLSISGLFCGLWLMFIGPCCVW